MKPICILNQNAPVGTFAGLERNGFSVIPLPPHRDLLPGEAAHADMQFCKIPGKTLLYAPDTSPSVIKALRERKISVTQGQTRLKPDYPGNIAYNILTVGNIYFHNLPFSDPLAVSLLAESGLYGVKVKQGYAACSAAAVTGTHIITGDRGLMAAAERHNITPIFLPDRDIVLNGYEHGFVGGCCGIYENTLFTCGKLPAVICKTVVDLGVSVVSVWDGPLTDIGGLLFL